MFFKVHHFLPVDIISSHCSFCISVCVRDGVLWEGVGQVKMRSSVGTPALMRTRWLQTNIFILHVKSTRALTHRAQGAHLGNTLEQDGAF